MYGEYQARVKSTRECEPQHRAEASLAAAQPVRHGAEDGRPDPDPGEEERAQKLHRGPGSKKKKKKSRKKKKKKKKKMVIIKLGWRTIDSEREVNRS